MTHGAVGKVYTSFLGLLERSVMLAREAAKKKKMKDGPVVFSFPAAMIAL
ncbi:hypothetical protein CCP2SC5_10022 [Azospirillaceae bacterium]